MRTGIFYLNNTGSRFVVLNNGKKEKITLETVSGKFVERTAIEYGSFGNFTTVLISYKGKKIRVLTDCLLND